MKITKSNGQSTTEEVVSFNNYVLNELSKNNVINNSDDVEIYFDLSKNSFNDIIVKFNFNNKYSNIRVILRQNLCELSDNLFEKYNLSLWTKNQIYDETFESGLNELLKTNKTVSPKKSDITIAFINTILFMLGLRDL